MFLDKDMGKVLYFILAFSLIGWLGHSTYQDDVAQIVIAYQKQIEAWRETKKEDEKEYYRMDIFNATTSVMYIIASSTIPIKFK